MDFSEMHALLVSSISRSRYQHTLGVIETASFLAHIHGADLNQAYAAALLHDAAKYMDTADMILISRREGFPPDDQEIEASATLHAPAGAALAKTVYGIKDPSVLHAIRSHTIGCLHPTKLDAILFVADFIEPGRKPFEGLEAARTLSRTDLLGAMKLCAKLSGDYVEKCGGKIHPITIKMINDTEALI